MYIRIYGFSKEKKLISILQADDLTGEELDVVLENTMACFRENTPHHKYREINQIMISITNQKGN